MCNLFPRIIRSFLQPVSRIAGTDISASIGPIGTLARMNGKTFNFCIDHANKLSTTKEDLVLSLATVPWSLFTVILPR